MIAFKKLDSLSKDKLTAKTIIKNFPILLFSFVSSLSLGIIIALVLNSETLMTIAGYKAHEPDRKKLIQKLKKIEREKPPIPQGINNNVSS